MKIRCSEPLKQVSIVVVVVVVGRNVPVFNI